MGPVDKILRREPLSGYREDGASRREKEASYKWKLMGLVVGRRRGCPGSGSEKQVEAQVPRAPAEVAKKVARAPAEVAKKSPGHLRKSQKSRQGTCGSHKKVARAPAEVAKKLPETTKKLADV